MAHRLDRGRGLMFRYLNDGGDWPLATLDGLVRDGTTLRLANHPGNPEAVGEALEAGAAIGSLGGMAVDAHGNVYLSDAAAHRVIRIPACGGRPQALRCLSRRGSEPGYLDRPGGLAYLPERNRLYIADTDNHRIVIIDVGTEQIVGLWGHPDPYAAPRPSTDAGRFSWPMDLAIDSANAVYVLESGGRVQKFDVDGDLDPTFIFRPAQAAGSHQVVIAVATFHGEERLLIVETNPLGMAVYRLTGAHDAELSRNWNAFVDLIGEHVAPSGAATGGDRIYVADTTHGRILVFSAAGNFVGFVHASGAPFTGLAIDGLGRLHATTGASVERFALAGHHVPSGRFLIGPIEMGRNEDRWWRAAVDVDAARDGTVQFFTLTTDTVGTPPWPTASDERLSGRAETPRDTWRAVPTNRTRFLVLNEQGGFLWIAGQITSATGGTPHVLQLRLDDARNAWIERMPRIYRMEKRETIERLLGLLEAQTIHATAAFDDLSRRYDAGVAPDSMDRSSWLEWLAECVSAELDGRWPDAQRRRAVREAFRRNAQRGTAVGLRHALRSVIGDAPVHISESTSAPGAWWLGSEGAALGFATLLSDGVFGGAVLDTTAVLDASQLVDSSAPDTIGVLTPALSVQVAAAYVSAARVPRAAVENMIAREVPAHLDTHVCFVDPRMRVGIQARIGIDTIIATQDPLCVDEGRIGAAVLAHSPPSEIGRARIGADTRLV